MDAAVLPVPVLLVQDSDSSMAARELMGLGPEASPGGGGSREGGGSQGGNVEMVMINN